jgi:hypothetical protein
MTRIVLTSKVGPDGVLHLTVPVGIEDADREVQVVIDPKRKPLSREEWRNWVLSLAGAWQGDFERAGQGELEVREQLP